MNNLHLELEGKTVLVLSKYLKPEVKDRRFLCEGGFGCSPITNGETIYGKWIADGEKDSIRGRWVESLSN